MRKKHCVVEMVLVQRPAFWNEVRSGDLIEGVGGVPVTVESITMTVAGVHICIRESGGRAWIQDPNVPLTRLVSVEKVVA